MNTSVTLAGMHNAATPITASQGNSPAIAMQNTANNKTSTLTQLHQPIIKSNTETLTYNYIDSFKNDARELRLTKVRDKSMSEQVNRLAIYENEIKQLRESHKATNDETQKKQIRSEINSRLNKLITDELRSLEALVKSMEDVIDQKELQKERGAAYTTRLVSQEQAMSFLNKLVAIDQSNSDMENQVDQQLYQKIAVIAIGGLLSTKVADVMRKAIQETKPFNNEAEYNSMHNKQSMIAENENRMDVLERTTDINLGALEGQHLNRGELPRILTELLEFMTRIDYNRIINNKCDNPPVAITKIAEFIKNLDTKTLKLIENHKQVLKLTSSLGLKPEIINSIGVEAEQIRKTTETTLGTIFTEKAKTSVNDILLRQSNSSLAELRRATAKTALHALVMAYNRKFTENPHYQQNDNPVQPLWQKKIYEHINKKYQIALSSSNIAEVKTAEEALLRELSTVANELRANSQEPFRLHKIADNRNFAAELANLLKQCLHSTEPEQINMALSLLSSVFSTTSSHTAHIFNRADNPKADNKVQHEADAKAALWMFEVLFQNKLINASQTKGFNEEKLGVFFKDLMQNKQGHTANPAMSVLFNFIKSSMIADESLAQDPDKEITMQKAEKHALYLYYLVMRNMPVDPNDTNNLHYMRLFSKLYLDTSFRKQLAIELNGIEQQTKDKYNLITLIDQAHRSKVNQLAKALEDDIEAKITNKAKNSEIQKVLEEYIKLEHDIGALGANQDYLGEVNIGNQNPAKANQYRMVGFKKLLPKLYNYNKNLALTLFDYYPRCRSNDGKINDQALKEAGEVLGPHLEKRLIANQNRIKIENRITPFINSIAKEDSTMITDERFGTLYNERRDHTLRYKLSSSNLSPELQAIIHQRVMKKETTREILPFKNEAGHIIVDSNNAEDLSSIEDIYKDVLVLAKTFPDSITKILNQPALSQTRAILNAQFIGIDRKEITDKNQAISEKLKHIESTYTELSHMGITPTRTIKAQDLRIGERQIAEFKTSKEQRGQAVINALGESDAQLVFSA